MKKVSAVIIILVGVLILFSNNIFNYLLDKNTDTAFQQLETLEPEDIESNINTEQEYDFKVIDYISPTKTYVNADEIDKNSVRGELIIPSVDINLVIFEGLSNAKLLSGVSTMKKDQVMGEGNFAIAGHYGFEDKLLYNLNKVKIGDEIKVTDKNKVYIYEAVKKEVVAPDRIDMIEDYKALDYDENIISIMNCDYENEERTGDRLFVIGELKEVIDYSEDIYIK